MATASLESRALTAETIEAELSDATIVVSEDAQTLATSFEKLTDRTFELLVYELFKAGGSLAEELRANRVQILPIGADRGRDIVLLANEKPIGVVQCKKHATPLTRPDALREIARFILAALIDPTLLTPGSALTYVLVVSKGLSEPAQILFNETARIVKKEDDLVRACAMEVLAKYEGLRGLDPTTAVEHVVSTLAKAKLLYLAAEDLDIWLKDRPHVYPKFFSARIVVDSALVEKGLAEIKRDISRGMTVENDRLTESWYHPSQVAAYSVVARAPAGSGAGPILLKDVYVPRHLQIEVDEWLTKGAKGPMGALVVVVAPGGFGKSSLLWQCHQLRNRQPNQHALLFSAALIEAKVERNEFERGLAALVQHTKGLIADGRSVVVCIDTFDVLAHRDDLRQAGLRLVGQLVAAGASVLMSSRPEEVAAIPLEEIADISVRLHLREFDDDEFDEAVARYCRVFYRDSPHTFDKVDEQITRMRELVALGRPVKQVCLNPLTFRMLFELYAPSEVPEDINSFQLYSEYWRWRVRTDRRAGLGPVSGRDLSSAVQWVASRMLARGTPSLLSTQISHGIIEGKLQDADEFELLSRHLLQRSNSDRLEFFHQTFFEHAAARHLYALGEMSLNCCVAKMREAADDAFCFPVYEQLFLLYAAREELSLELDRHVGDLLSAEHPALSGAGLHAHMLAEQGYSAGCRVVEEAVRKQNFHLLKRFTQRIHHLHRRRVREVVDLIAVVWQNRSWSQMEAVSQLFSWLAQSDWAVCRRELERTDFVGELSHFAHSSTLDPEHLGILVFRRGLSADPVWSITQLFRFKRNSHAARAVLEFIGAQAAKLSLAAAQAAQSQVLERFSVSTRKVDGLTLEYSASCLAAIWTIHTSLAHIDPATISLDSSPRSNLLLRAAAISSTPTLTALRRCLIRRVTDERELLPFFVLMHQFMTPFLMEGKEIDATAWKDAIVASEALLEEALSGESNRSGIASREFSSLYARKRTAGLPWTRLFDQPPGHWLRSSCNPRLLAIALAEGSPTALAALEQMCGDPQTYAARLATLRGVLSDFPVGETCFLCFLRISEALSAPSPLLTMLEQAEAGDARAFLTSTIASHELRISALARLAQQSKKESSRSAGTRLIAFLIRNSATTRPSYVEVSSLLKGAPIGGERAAALSLLVQVTVPTTGAETVAAILRSVDPKNARSHNIAVVQLHEVLALPGVNLPKDLCNLVLDFCLLETASEPQVSLAGRLINLYLGIGDVTTANAIGLRVLRSPTVRLLSATQKKTLGHHLDKPFVDLYRRNTADDLGMHLVELRQVDEHLGRLIAVSLCKSERKDLSKLLTAVTGDVGVPTSLRRVVQDYRQHLLRL